MNDTDTILKQISEILLRSFIVAMALLILWLVIYLMIGNYWYISHTKFFDLTEHELSLFNYAGMGLFKILALCFMLGPFVAIKMVLGIKKNKDLVLIGF
ncbi:MAG: hypothetical protein HKO79_12245 [Desulfobacterales bacterium]|nr:hypothetical protein [Desulfobacterales bacterium]